jgi:hypothetical protein
VIRDRGWELEAGSGKRGAKVSDDKPGQDRWGQLNKCPECGKEMQRDAAVGEKIGLFYRCPTHGRFRYSWDHDRLEPE